MAAVAKRCGFTTMAVYRHVANKDDLMRRMLDVVLGSPPPFDTSHLALFAGRGRGAVARALASTGGASTSRSGRAPQAATAQLAWLDRGLEAMASTGLHEGDKAEIVLVLNGFVFWSARLRQSILGDTVEAVIPPYA